MIYKISSSDLTLSVDSVGIQMISVKDKNNMEYIWQRNPEVWGKCAPVLFPVVGRSRNEILNIGGKDYHMPIHGFIQGRDIDLVSKTEGKLVFCLKSNNETKKMYPFDFEFYVAFEVEGKQVKCSFDIKNTGKEDMYCGVGGHPGFNCPLDDSESFENWQLEFEYDEPLLANDVNMETVEISGTAKHEVKRDKNVVGLTRELFATDAIVLEDIKSKYVKLVSSKTRKGIKFNWESFPTIAFWTKYVSKDAKYVCIEPWQSMGFRNNEGNTIEEKYGILKIGSGKSEKKHFAFEII